MRNQISEKQIEKAILAIKTSEINTKDSLNVTSAFHGYISSFGAAVVQSGILPAILFFEDDGNAKEERSKLMKAICLMNDWEVGSHKNNLSLLYRDNNDKEAMKNQILKAAVALKLALRTFKKTNS